MTLFLRYLFPIIVLTWPAVAMPLLADVTSLSFTPRPNVSRLQRDHYDVPLCFCAAMQVQQFGRDGSDIALSPQYMITVAGRLQPRDDITIQHGWSSAILGWQLAHSFGAPPASMYTQVRGVLTDEVHEAAQQFTVGQEFMTFNQLPNYPSTLGYIAQHPGAVAILTTSGRRAFAIIGVDAEGRGLWLDYWQRTVPQVLHLSEPDGVATWNAMLYADKELGPENFMVVLTPR